jgi:hypothetical protein
MGTMMVSADPARRKKKSTNIRRKSCEIVIDGWHEFREHPLTGN